MKEAALKVHSTETSDGPWDGPKTEAAIPADATAEDLASVYAWVDPDGDEAVKASYKFIHHEGVGGPANVKALTSGIGVLNGGMGGTTIPAEDVAGVYAHLAAHLTDAGVEEIPPLKEADLGTSFDDRRSLLQAAVNDALGVADDAEWPARPYVRDVFDTAVVWAMDGASYMADYSITDGAVTLGTPSEVRASYEPITGGTAVPPAPEPAPAGEAFDPKSAKALTILAEAMMKDPNWAAEVAKVAASLSPTEVSGDFVALTERAVADDGLVDLRVIVPGWGSSGYYSPEVLERDGPLVFTQGTKMFWNHQTDAEEEARPEGDLRDLAGELVEDAKWMAEGPEGAGLYAKAKVFAGFRDVVDELAPHIGVSIRAMGKATDGTIEGREGPVIDALTSGRSVDFVTAPGAGGKVLSLFESALGRKGELTMEETKELKEAKDARDAALGDLAKRDAKDIVTAAIAEAKLPEAAAKKLIEALPAKATLKDGKLDTDALTAVVTEAIASEVAYLTELTGAGQVQGLGGSKEDAAKVTEDLEGAFQDMGLGESAAKIAAQGR